MAMIAVHDLYLSPVSGFCILDRLALHCELSLGFEGWSHQENGSKYIALSIDAICQVAREVIYARLVDVFGGINIFHSWTKMQIWLRGANTIQPTSEQSKSMDDEN